MPRPRLPLLLVALSLAGCRADADAPPRAARPGDSAAAAAAPDTMPRLPAAWRANPAEGVALRPNGMLLVETGPHAVLWPGDAQELAPPYTIAATLYKRAGRLNEGYGIVFGGAGLERPEAEQAYGYFLVRGDGSFLVKRRAGAETPVVHDWTRHPAVQRDDAGGGGRNALQVRAGADSVAFVVNGTEVARVPAADLPVRGRAGLRVAHDVVLEVEGFRAEPGAAGEAVAP